MQKEPNIKLTEAERETLYTAIREWRNKYGHSSFSIKRNTRYSDRCIKELKEMLLTTKGGPELYAGGHHNSYLMNMHIWYEDMYPSVKEDFEKMLISSCGLTKKLIKNPSLWGTREIFVQQRTLPNGTIIRYNYDDNGYSLDMELYHEGFKTAKTHGDIRFDALPSKELLDRIFKYIEYADSIPLMVGKYPKGYDRTIAEMKFSIVRKLLIQDNVKFRPYVYDREVF